MAYRHAQPNFSKGEISDEILGRFDVSAYSAGLKRARNVIVMKYGGVTKRSGTRLVAEVYDATKPVRLIPFQFSLDQTYALEMGQGYMRPAALGGIVVEEELAVAGITNDFPAEVEIAYHNFVVGDQVYLTGQAGMTEINGTLARVLQITGEHTFTIDVDTTSFGVWSANSGGATRTSAPPPPSPPPPVPPPPPPPPPPPIYSGGAERPGSGGGGDIP